jgi:hypothetical protein
MQPKILYLLEAALLTGERRRRRKKPEDTVACRVVRTLKTAS